MIAPHEAIERFLKLADAIELLDSPRFVRVVAHGQGEEKESLKTGLSVAVMEEVEALAEYGLKIRKKIAQAGSDYDLLQAVKESLK